MASGKLVRATPFMVDSHAAALRAVLDSQGIRVHMQSGYLPGLVALMVDEDDLGAAEIIVGVAGEAPTGDPVDCASCGEIIPSGFGECWNCSAPVADDPPSTPR